MPVTSSPRSLSKPAALTTGFCLVALTAFAADKAAEEPGKGMSGMDHSQMDHSGHSMDTARDAEGRSLYGMKHKMDPAMTKELREKVALYKNYSDAEIALSMDMMGPEYAWYISPPDVKGEQGILILMHGFREQGDKIFRQQVQPMGDIFPTSMGVGMAMMMSDHIQVALDDLKAAGAKKIVVVPITSSATNELYRQWLYIFGKQDKPEFATVPRVKTDAKLLFVKPPGDDPLVAEVLLDHATEISKDPEEGARHHRGSRPFLGRGQCRGTPGPRGPGQVREAGWRVCRCPRHDPAGRCAPRDPGRQREEDARSRGSGDEEGPARAGRDQPHRRPDDPGQAPQRPQGPELRVQRQGAGQSPQLHEVDERGRPGAVRAQVSAPDRRSGAS